MPKPDKVRVENKVDEVPEKISESSEYIKVPVEVQVSPELPKQYIHIDQFLQTAAQLYDLNRMQIAGFKAYMQGNHYQYDQEVFLQGLKKYLNL